ncbi:MAG: 23S rRNA (adenine(2503)-C(2))-methyltransferase RlmN [Miniphocaeibacter sp.]|uniref:23S rRNA (adenine(2503)-C(2))-methyltransferase RlmN n=1 Tax=Miniphocaeibacter sp. TaxID=3100973 RepID=UPI00184CE6CB|nr:23S rRNA (adenine(2503)-C(2))-methyltransferase RlmN [Gallicola sp.]
MKKISYNNMDLKELEDFFISIDEKKFRAEQLFIGLHNKNYFDLDEFTNISKELKSKLKDYGFINKSEISKVFKSKLDNTRKYLIKLNDGNIIESVYMEYSSHNTICISSQVGCRMGCTFCASTKQKFVRNLQPSELLNQIYLIQKDVGKRISNIVLMGIGEPLDNYNNVLKFIKILSDKKGYNISKRNITLSTCGIVPRIHELANEDLPINITISLHNPFDEERRKIMPIGNRYSVEEIIEATKYYFQKTGRRISFEYTLIEGENDSYTHAKELRRILRGLNCHVNLIPLNKIKEFNKNSSNRESIKKFKSYLDEFGITTTIRTSLGQDIDGACGQLRAAHNFN